MSLPQQNDIGPGCSDEQHEESAGRCATQPESDNRPWPSSRGKSVTHVEGQQDPWHASQDYVSQKYTSHLINDPSNLATPLSPDCSHHFEPWNPVGAIHVNELDLGLGDLMPPPISSTHPHAPVQTVFPNPVPTSIRSNAAINTDPFQAESTTPTHLTHFRDTQYGYAAANERALHHDVAHWLKAPEADFVGCQDWFKDPDAADDALFCLQEEAYVDNWASLQTYDLGQQLPTSVYNNGGSDVVIASQPCDSDGMLTSRPDYHEHVSDPQALWENEAISNSTSDLVYCGDWLTPSFDSVSPMSNAPSLISASARRWSNGAQSHNSPEDKAFQRRKPSRRLTVGPFEPKPGPGWPQLAADAARRRFESSLGRKRLKPTREGPLTQIQRKNAAEHRRRKSVCIRCRWCKIPCVREDPDGPCTNYLTIVSGRIWEQPCTKADFLEVVKSGTLNYISQRAINHYTVDESRRIRLELPETFQLNDLISLLNDRKGPFNIRARQASGSLYTIDLHECAKYLTEINKRKNHSERLCYFIDHDILKADHWLDCVKDCDPTTNVLALLGVWNNMPSRASYDFVSRNDTIDSVYLPMNVETEHGRIDIMLAAQLSRIVCRKLEVAGYAALQKLLNGWHDQPADQQAIALQQIGHILLTLRWRVSWWELLGDGGRQEQVDIVKQRFEDRVTRLCRVLYFYYCNIRKKLPSFSDTKGLEGIWSRYADAGLVYDDFPKIESLSGFQEWMSRGKELIVEAGVAGNLDKIKAH